MRTLRAFFWGSVIGAILGYLFAPRHTDILRAELETTRDEPMGQGASAAS